MSKRKPQIAYAQFDALGRIIVETIRPTEREVRRHAGAVFWPRIRRVRIEIDE